MNQQANFVTRRLRRALTQVAGNIPDKIKIVFRIDAKRQLTDLEVYSCADKNRMIWSWRTSPSTIADKPVAAPKVLNK
jgi:hypothetical protein